MTVRENWRQIPANQLTDEELALARREAFSIMLGHLVDYSELVSQQPGRIVSVDQVHIAEWRRSNWSSLSPNFVAEEAINGEEEVSTHEKPMTRDEKWADWQKRAEQEIEIAKKRRE